MSDLRSTPVEPERQWKNTRLSIERPYKDDSGNRLPVLYDLTPEGERIYEPKETASAKLESCLRRIFLERGTDFFERKEGPRLENTVPSAVGDNERVLPDPSIEAPSGPNPKIMTVEELYTMRSEILPQLFVALGEMSHARDLLNSVLSTPPGIQGKEDLPSPLSATLVTKPPPITSVQAFNGQLTIGTKDESLRKAATLFKSAAESMERSRLKGEKYWVDALRVRRANWGLTPAPLPLGAATGKGADKTSKDFVISYGLEGSPTLFRRRAVAHLSILGDSSPDILFPFHQHTRLKISISASTGSASSISTFDSLRPNSEGQNLDSALKTSQSEIVDQEIFSLLVKEAGNLPTASARVSERLIVIDAAQGLYLTFELVDGTVPGNTESFKPSFNQNISELIYHVLRVLLLHEHNHANVEKRLPQTKTIEIRSSILQPIIDILQYRVFCERVEMELRNAVNALNSAGIPSTLSFTSVGEVGQQLVSLLSGSGNKVVGGEAIIRMDNWHTVWFTFVSPSTLTAHLSQATLAISSLPQLSQLLRDETERCLLRRICDMGRHLSRSVGGVWFIDLNRCVGRWERCVLNFRITFGDDSTIGCSAFRLNSKTGQHGCTETFTGGDKPLLTWVKSIIEQAPHEAS